MIPFGSLLEQDVSNWLYGEWNEDKLKTFTALYSLPGVHQYFDYLLDRRADKEYLDRYGMDYTDIHDPRKLKQTSSGSSLVGYGQTMISKNVNRLYRDRH